MYAFWYVFEGNRADYLAFYSKSNGAWLVVRNRYYWILPIFCEEMLPFPSMRLEKKSTKLTRGLLMRSWFILFGWVALPNFAPDSYTPYREVIRGYDVEIDMEVWYGTGITIQSSSTWALPPVRHVGQPNAVDASNPFTYLTSCYTRYSCTHTA